MFSKKKTKKNNLLKIKIRLSFFFKFKRIFVAFQCVILHIYINDYCTLYFGVKK